MKAALASAHRQKMRGLVKSINECLVESKLESFAIKITDNEKVKDRKIHQLKILLEKRPELAQSGIGRNISLYEQEKTLLRLECQNVGKSDVHDSIVLGTIMAAVGHCEELKWADSIKTVGPIKENDV